MNNYGLPQEGVDFDFVEPMDEEVISRSKNPIIKLYEKYDGVVIQYGKISVIPDVDNPRISFDFAILQPGSYTKEELNLDTEFKDMLGNIIASVIIEVHNEYDKHRNNNS